MEQESKIITLFEFTQQGYEETQQSLNALLKAQRELLEEQKEAGRIYSDSSSDLAKMTKKYEEFNKTLNSKSSAASRKEFEELKAAMLQTQAQVVSLTGKMSDLGKQSSNNAKKIQQEQATYNAYNKVMEELSKGVGEAKTNMDNLAKAQKYLRDELSKQEIGSDQYVRLSKELAMVSNTMQGVRKEQQQQTKSMNVEEGSVEALRQKVIKLKDEWKGLNQNSPEFGKVRDELKATTDQLNTAEQAVGIYSRNVGNYASAFEGLGGAIQNVAPGFSSLVNGIKQATAAGLKFIATPIGAVIGALVVAIKAVKEAFSRSAEGQEKYNKLMGALSGIVTVLMDTLADLGEFLISIFTEPEKAYDKFKKYVLDPLLFQFKTVYNAAMGVGNAIAGIFSEEARERSKEYFNNIKNDFNDLKETALEVWDGIKNKVDQIGTKMKEGVDIAEMENKLKRERLNTTQEIADNEVRIAEIRNKAAQRDRKNVKEQQDALSQLVIAQKLIQRNSDIRISQLRQEYEIQKAKNAMGKSTQEDLQKEADLRANITREEKASQDQQREIITQIAEIKASMKDQLKTLVADRITAEQNVATAEAKVRELNYKNASEAEKKRAEDSLKAHRNTLAVKIKAQEEYNTESISLTQQERDAIELQELLGSKAVEEIRMNANKAMVDSYNSAVDNVRDAQEKVINAEKEGNTELISLYTQLLQARQDKLKEYDQTQLIYTQEQREARDIEDAEYLEKQKAQYVAGRQSLYALEVEYNNAETDAQRDKLRTQVDNQKNAVDSMQALLESAEVDVEKLWEKEKIYITDASEYIGTTLADTIGGLDVTTNKVASAFTKLATSASKSFSKIFDIRKDMEKGLASVSEFQRAVASASLQAVSESMTIATSIIQDNLDKQRTAIEEASDFQLEQSQRVYERQQADLDRRLSNNEISEARYRIEQIKAEDAQAEKEKAIERSKAEKIYAIDVKQFRTQQAQDASQAAIATALAIIQGYAQTGPIAGSVFAGIVGAIGAAQVAAIMAKKPPQKPEFAKGGLIDLGMIKGKSHANGGVPVSIGDDQVAEVEGGEGALIISKKAMKNKEMKAMLGVIASLNESISGSNANSSKFAEGGYMTYDDFYNEAMANMDIVRKKRKLWVNGVKYKLPNKGRGAAQDAIVQEEADRIATQKFEEYRKKELQKLEAQEKRMTAAQDRKMASNSILQGMGISDYAGYQNTLNNSSEKQKQLQDQINAYKELADIRQADLKKQMDYDNKMLQFEKRIADADKELEDSTLSFNKDILEDLLKSGEISKNEYLSYLDQIEKGYGASTSDIIALKKKQVEATKKLIEEERAAALQAANDEAQFQEKALEQIREEWNTHYEETTEAVLSDLSAANESISELSEADLERFNKMVSMSERIKEIDEETAALNKKYSENENELNDGIIRSREEQLALEEEQKRIQAEIAAKEEERQLKEEALEAAKEEFQESRENAMEAALKAFETQNFDDILGKVKELGKVLQEQEANNLTLDKALAASLEEQLKSINSTYDAEIAAQDAIIDNLNEQLSQLNLIHDKKVADANAEQELFEDNFNRQKELIDKAYQQATSGLTSQLQDVNAVLANLKIAGIQTGVSEYEKAIQNLTSQINNLPSKYATGGVIDMGGGVYNAVGSSHSYGGIPVSIGGSKIAEVEGGEKMFTVNKFASMNPLVSDALKTISDVNKSYTGVPLMNETEGSSGQYIDIELLAQLIGREINSRPSEMYMTTSKVNLAIQMEKSKRKAKFMI